ncbi:DUF4282 domain-containing protein [Paramesorhizobium deserti]|nr:DUF4282 domain-containing protein [Paramesorhizobium deserti]
MAIKDLLGFEKFLTPVLVKIVYWLGVIGVIGSAIVTFATAFSQTGGASQMIGAILMLIGGLIVWRVLCESTILIFRIYDRLTEIRDQGRAQR